jgi:hypothetical protein
MSTQTVTPPFKIPVVPNQKEADKLVKPLVAQSADLVIKDEDGYLASWALVERHDTVIAKIGEMFDPFVDGLHKLHKMAIWLRAEFLDPVVDSKKRLLGIRKDYRTKQERIAQEKRDRDAEILRKAQAKDLVKEAKQYEKAGDTETAEVLREQAQTMPAPIIPVMPATAKQEGSVLKKSWKFVVENEAIVPHEYFTLDPAKVRKVVNALGDKANIPGVRIWQEEDEHSRAVR